MIDILSICGVILFLFIGFKYPRKSGWAIVILVPLLYPSTFTLVYSKIFPLTINRIAIAITVGIVLHEKKYGFSLNKLLKSNVFIFVIIFSIGYVLVSITDRPLQNIIFTFLPTTFYPFILCFIIIKEEKDLYKLTKIFAWQAGIIGLFIIIEYLTQVRIAVILAKTNPHVDIYSLWEGLAPEYYRRSEMYRACGIDGHPVFTGFRLAFLFPITLWYASQNKFIGSIIVFITALGVLLLQARMAIVVIIIASIFIIFLTNRKIIFPVSIVGIISMLFLLYTPSLNVLIKDFWYQSFAPIMQGLNNPDMARRYDHITYAIGKFLDNPLLGSGSPDYVLMILMGCDDLPAPIIYLVSGGILLFLSYILMIFSFPLSIFKFQILNSKYLSSSQKYYLKFMTIAFFSGVFVVFSNWCERHFLIMFMLYISIFKIFIYNSLVKNRHSHRSGNPESV